MVFGAPNSTQNSASRTWRTPAETEITGTAGGTRRIGWMEVGWVKPVDGTYGPIPRAAALLS